MVQDIKEYGNHNQILKKSQMFDIETIVITKRGKQRLSQILKEDEILTLNPFTFEKEFVEVRLKVLSNQPQTFCRVNESLLTCYHPVKLPVSSKFFTPVSLRSDLVSRPGGIDLCLTKNHIVVLPQHVLAVTYGHQLSSTKNVLVHDFFSTSRCVQEAERLSDGSGIVSIYGFNRSRSDGLVNGFLTNTKKNDC
jgi:hypothetical protein